MSDGGVGLRNDGCAGKDFSRGLIAPVLCVLACLAINLIGRDILLQCAVCEIMNLSCGVEPSEAVLVCLT